MSNQSIQLIGLALMAYALFGRNSQETQRYYILPNGLRVAETQLPAHGYVYYQGNWIRAEALNQYFGTNTNAWDWQNAINQGFDLIQEGVDIWNMIVDLFEDEDND